MYNSFVCNVTDFGKNKIHLKVPKLESCSLLGFYALSSVNILPTFRGNVLVLSSSVKKTRNLELLEDGIDTLSRNVGTELPLNAG